MKTTTRIWVRATVVVLATQIINHFGTEKPFGAKFVVMLLKTVNTQYIYYSSLFLSIFKKVEFTMGNSKTLQIIYYDVLRYKWSISDLQCSETIILFVLFFPCERIIRSSIVEVSSALLSKIYYHVIPNATHQTLNMFYNIMYNMFVIHKCFSIVYSALCSCRWLSHIACGRVKRQQSTPSNAVLIRKQTYKNTIL